MTSQTASSTSPRRRMLRMRSIHSLWVARHAQATLDQLIARTASSTQSTSMVTGPGVTTSSTTRVTFERLPGASSLLTGSRSLHWEKVIPRSSSLLSTAQLAASQIFTRLKTRRKVSHFSRLLEPSCSTVKTQETASRIFTLVS